MILRVLHVLTMCICLGQICFGSSEMPEGMRNELKNVVGKINGASEQFVDDVMIAFETYHDNAYFRKFLWENLLEDLIHKSSKAKNTTIDVNSVEEFFNSRNYVYLKRQSSAIIPIIMEEQKIFQLFLSKQLPPERYNGLVNWCYIFLYENATSEEIESALGYLYGNDTAATKTSFLTKFPDLTATDCPVEFQSFSESFNELKSLSLIKPKVVQDFNTIGEKFPCEQYARLFLRHFIHVIKELHGDKSKINACMMKENPGHWNWPSYLNTRREMESTLQKIESIFSTRLPDESFRGLINFLKATIPDTPIDEIERALEYLYDDVPTTECSTNESSTLKTD